MPYERSAIVAFNRGIIGRLGLARIDLGRAALSAAVQVNWMPRALGSMMLRPGLEYISGTAGGATAKLMPFVFSIDDTAQLELTDGILRVRVDDELVTRATVTAAVTNGAFTSDLTGWTDNDESGAASSWTAGALALLGTGTNAAIRDQQVTVNEANTEHGLRIEVLRGPVILRVGSSSGADDYINETVLGTGSHALAFTPTGNFHIRIMGRRSFTALVDSIVVDTVGVMELATPWGEEHFDLLRYVQSGDIIYVACDGLQQRKIERRGTNSWSIVLYEPETGPFRNVNTGPIELTPSGLTGDISIAASKPFFESTNVGSLFRIQSSGQTVTESINAQNTFSDPIRVAGVGGQRAFGISIAGTFTATVTLQYSVAEPGNWVDATSYTTVQSISYNDELDNQIIYYRIGVKTGGFTSGPVDVTLTYTSGSIIGVARITGFSTEQSVTAVVLQDMGATTASTDWWEGSWSDRRGWPSSVTIHESRMSWAGNDNIYMSISDQYEDFDDEFEGDAGPIKRSIGEGPVETIAWLMSLTRLMVGTLSSAANVTPLRLSGNNPLSGRSSSFDEPLTPTNFNLKTTASSGMFVDSSTTKLYSLNWDVNENDYVPEDLSVAAPDLNENGIIGIAVQYKPDMRIWCWRNNGSVAVLIRERAENVLCWIEIETEGNVEDISILPGTVEDRVYFVVRRTIDGEDVRYVEKMALESECRGDPVCKLADAFLYYSGAATTTITGLEHLEGEEVVVWGWNTTTPFTSHDRTVGRDFGTFTVTDGEITGLSAAVTDACVGKGYNARFKSAKQAFGAALGTPLNQLGRITHIGLVLADTHAFGLQYGPSFDELDDMPGIEEEEEVDENRVYEDYDFRMMEFDDDWKSDPRFCLVAAAPRPCTVLAATVGMIRNG